ncbi:hypothetical protein CMO91_04550 [Candidatus Woesearchaeota archaeon]|nr:hypothetical protein [Candidatus Woesearchaeota archaeon]
MAPIKNLDRLMNSMNPRRVRGEYVFCTMAEKKVALAKDALLSFREQEGRTLIIEKSLADNHGLKYESVWAMITLTVHSDLTAVGFLARITNRLAEEGISVNVVSAYYHDHLFVPYDKAQETMKLLKEMTRA